MNIIETVTSLGTKWLVFEAAALFGFWAFLIATAPHSRNPKEYGITPRATPNQMVALVFRHVDQDRHLAIVHPVVAPDLGVVLDSGPRALEQNTVLLCVPDERRIEATNAAGEKILVGELLLVCGEQTFAVKSINFDPK